MTRRLVNAYVVGEFPTSFGTTYTAHIQGAWGRPEEAVAAAEKIAAKFVPVWQGREGYAQRVVGVHIIDVQTSEQWMVPVG